MNLPNDPKATARYAALIVALGLQADTLDPQHAATLARLAAWTADRDTDTLAHLIRRGNGRATAACRLILAEVVELLDQARTYRNEHGTVVGYELTVPAPLARRVRAAAKETSR